MRSRAPSYFTATILPFDDTTDSKSQTLSGRRVGPLCLQTCRGFSPCPASAQRAQRSAARTHPGSARSRELVRAVGSAQGPSSRSGSLSPATPGCSPAAKAPLLPLLGGPKRSHRRGAAQPSWMGFADEGRSWEGAELSPQLSAEGSPAGTGRRLFPLCCAGEAQKAPVPRRGAILPRCKPLSRRLHAWNKCAPFPPAPYPAPAWTGCSRSLAVQQCFTQHR